LISKAAPLVSAMTDAPPLAKSSSRQSALMHDDSWEVRRRLMGKRVLVRNWRPDKVKVEDGSSILTTCSPGQLLREYRAAALAVMAWADDVTFEDSGIWLIPPPRHVHQPWRTLAYHLAVVHLGARKADVARAAHVSERAINFACWRIERDRDDEAVDAALVALEQEAGLMMLRCLAAEGARGCQPPAGGVDSGGVPPWLAALDDDMIAELLPATTAI
jgi:hypothetical protein